MVSFAFADNLFLLVLNDTAKIHNKIKINAVNVTVLLMFFIVFPPFDILSYSIFSLAEILRIVPVLLCWYNILLISFLLQIP